MNDGLPRVRPSLRRTRTLLGVLTALVVGSMGVKTARLQAGPWTDGRFGGESRAALVFDHDDAMTVGTLSVFAGGSFSTALSAFEPGLMVRTAFGIPGGYRGVLIMDLARTAASDRWLGENVNGLRARYYIYSPVTGSVIYDGVNVRGVIDTQTRVLRSGSLGFRLTGWLDLADPGPDGVPGSDDDRIVTVEVDLESRPSPEALGASLEALAEMPAVQDCAARDCYYDPAYDNVAQVVAGCDSGGPVYGEGGGGCGSEGVSGDTMSSLRVNDAGELIGDAGRGGDGATRDAGDDYEDVYGDDYEDVALDPYGYDADTVDSPGDGCDGASSDSGGGCEGDSWSGSGSGCGSEGGEGSGCGSSDSGCEGDTFASQAGPPVSRPKGRGGWLVVLALALLVLWIHREEPVNITEDDGPR